MSQHVTPTRLEAALVERLRAIPDGQITKTAARAGLPLRHLVRLRKGENVDVRLSTLERVAKGLECSAAELITSLSREVHAPGVAGVLKGATAVKAARAPEGLVRLSRHAAQIGAGPGLVDPLEEPREYTFAVQWLKRLGYQNPTDDDPRLQVFKVARTFGDSMEPVIRPDAILLADMGSRGRGHAKVEEGRIYVLDLSGNDSGLLVKRVAFNRKKNELVLWGDNRAYAPDTVAIEERPLQEIVRGKVRWVGQEVS